MKQLDLQKVKVVSWDIDGTMYDLHLLMSGFKKDLLRRMFSLNWVQAWRDFLRLLRFKLYMDRVRKAAGDYRVGTVPKRARIEETQDEMYGRILAQIGPLPGVLELMDWFKQHGYTQVVFSDYRPSTKLDALGVGHFFERIYAGEDIGHLKPAAASFEHIIADLSIAPDEFLHIGDRADTDGGAAEEVGYQVALIGIEYPTANALREQLEQAKQANP